MYIFGKFDALERRLQKILDMFETIRIYSALERSKIEGLEPMIGKYQVKFTRIFQFFWMCFSICFYICRCCFLKTAPTVDCGTRTYDVLSS